MIRSRSLLLAALLIAAPFHASPADAQTIAGASRAAASLILYPGDAIRIQVWNLPEYSGDFKIGVDGKILHPLYQNIQVAEVPFEQLIASLRDFLSESLTSPQFVVEPLFRVRLGGEVRQASTVLVTPETTLAQAIWNAGGPTERGRLDQVRLVRNGVATVIDLTDPNPQATEFYLRSGDEVIVGRRRSIFRDYIVPTSSFISAVYAIFRFVERITP
ncbi:MAG TPA: polysaccharide biosynthesis/export family protein [Longimicrobiales bacterium]|nr:polysaccharide biosynthesis/export family protein [Longimicrobiales bacterium]